jgi:hypothetical protein
MLDLALDELAHFFVATEIVRIKAATAPAQLLKA